MVCHANTKNYNQLFSDRFISNQILTAQDIKNYINNRSDKVNFMPSDSEVIEGFNDSKLINKQSTGILYFIDTKIRNRQLQAVAMMGLNRYSLEHIMPKKWENNWPPVRSEGERLFRNRKLLTLGNLTIITASLNSSLRDSSCDVKKNGRSPKKVLNY